LKILIVSDIHANLVALEAVLKAAGEFDEFWNLGDTVGYGPRPAESLRRAIALNAEPMLAGNHDLASTGKLDDRDFNTIARAAARWTSSQLSPGEKLFLNELPSLVVKNGVTLAHGSPRDPIWEYLTSVGAAADVFRTIDSNVCFVGHSHIACWFQLDDDNEMPEMDLWQDQQTIDLTRGRFIINPGSVGQPRDRDPRASFGILDTDRFVFTGHRVDYDVRRTQEQMELARLPLVLIKRLASGR
jgi:diadenosine tetraphosphatase ApaH/serine/threonine PP2A family protein phosphatase